MASRILLAVLSIISSTAGILTGPTFKPILSAVGSSHQDPARLPSSLMQDPRRGILQLRGGVPGDPSDRPASQLRALPAENSGECFKCKLPGHWSSECTADSPATVQGAGGGGSAKFGECFKCKQAGHWASKCTAEAPGGAVGGAAPSGSTASVERPCFKCNQVGHWASQCNAEVTQTHKRQTLSPKP
jgi:hypothetical protein